MTFFQADLEKNFYLDDDSVIEQLQIAMEELRKAKLDLPPPPTVNELPTLPFGLEIQPSIQQIIGRRNSESIDEHFRRNPRMSGRQGYRKKRGQPGTPGVETRSIQSSRNSEYSIDEKSSEYDTAANSRVSLGTGQSSRTSFADASDIPSTSTTMSRQRSPRDENDVDAFDQVTLHAAPSTHQSPTQSTSAFNHNDNSPDQTSNPASEVSEYDNVNGSYGGSPEHYNEQTTTYKVMSTSRSDGYIAYQQNDVRGAANGQYHMVKQSSSMPFQDGVTHSLRGRRKVSRVTAKAQIIGQQNGHSVDQYGMMERRQMHKKSDIPETAFL